MQGERGTAYQSWALKKLKIRGNFFEPGNIVVEDIMAQHETSIPAEKVKFFKRGGTYLLSCRKLKGGVAKYRTYGIYAVFLIDLDIEKQGLLDDIVLGQRHYVRHPRFIQAQFQWIK